MDVYTERTIKLMKENRFADYLRVMGKSELPDNNLITLALMKVREFEKAANDEILKEAMERKAAQEKLNAKL